MVKVENPDLCYKGKVWWMDEWKIQRWGFVMSVINLPAGNGKLIPYAQIAERNDRQIMVMVELSKCWPTRKEMVKAEETRAAMQIQEYKDSIKDGAGLVRFLYNHDIISENCDEEAEEAAVQKAKEIFGIDLRH